MGSIPVKTKLPKTLYVRWDYPENGDPWLVTGDSGEELLENATDQKTIGVYELKKTVLVKSTVSVSVMEKT